MKFEEEYDGKKIVIDDGMDGQGHSDHTGSHLSPHVSLYINDIEVHVMKNRYGKYFSHHLPYQEYSTPLKLARALIDKVPLFKINKEKF